MLILILHFQKNKSLDTPITITLEDSSEQHKYDAPPALYINDTYYQMYQRIDVSTLELEYIGSICNTIPSTEIPNENFTSNELSVGTKVYTASSLEDDEVIIENVDITPERSIYILCK